MPWNIENYYILGGRVLCIEITIPLIDFIYINIDDVKQAWIDLLREVVQEEPGLEVSWEMVPREKDALVTIRIAKKGELERFTSGEISRALGVTDALAAEEEKTASGKKSTKKKKTAAARRKTSKK